MYLAMENNNCKPTNYACAKCAVCGVTRLRCPERKFFRFPKDSERCRVWQEKCNVPRLFQKSPNDLYSRYRICSIHFEESSYKTIKRHFLHSCAVPTKFMRELASSVMETIPTNVKDIPWVIKMPSTMMEECSKVGKWLLFLDKAEKDDSGLTDLDKAWALIKDIVDEGYLRGAKCSTGYNSPNYDPNNGVIVCYTNDYTDKKDVKSAAEAIRKVIYYEAPLYYKTNEATLSAEYRVLGNRAIAMYRHSISGKLYEREEETSEWILAEI